MRSTTAVGRALLGLCLTGLGIGGLFLAGCSGDDIPPSRQPVSPTPAAIPDLFLSAPPTVHVRLSAPTRAGEAHVRVRGSFQVRDLDGRVQHHGRDLDEVVRLDASGVRVAGVTLPRHGGVVVPATSGAIQVGDRHYPGDLRIARCVDGRCRLYIVTDLETYVMGVVPGEIPAKFPRASQRVQAILARTYALSNVKSALRGATVMVSDSGGEDQEYVGIPAVARHRSVARDAVESTRGQVLIDGEAPLRAWYHSTCGGSTAPAHTVFDTTPRDALGGVPCEWCSESKYHRWEASIPAAEIVRAARLRGRLTAFAVGATDPGGRATTFHVTTDSASTEVAAPAFRLSVGASRLRSVHVDTATIDTAGSGPATLELSGRGWGHGVGLCQMGAKGMAEDGRSAERIVAYYYPGSGLVRLW